MLDIGLNMTKKLLILLGVALSFLAVSCTETNSGEGSAFKGLREISRPTEIRLQYTDGLEDTVRLRWKGSIPEMDMTGVNSGEGWATGTSEKEEVFYFGQNKFYGLELDFRRKTFTESGFDGAPLPNISGTWVPIR